VMTGVLFHRGVCYSGVGFKGSIPIAPIGLVRVGADVRDVSLGWVYGGAVTFMLVSCTARGAIRRGPSFIHCMILSRDK
jgi:hypothetical protein